MPMQLYKAFDSTRIPVDIYIYEKCFKDLNHISFGRIFTEDLIKKYTKSILFKSEQVEDTSVKGSISTSVDHYLIKVDDKTYIELSGESDTYNEDEELKNSSYCRVIYESSSYPEELIKYIGTLKCVYKRPSQVYLIVRGSGGYNLRHFAIKPPVIDFDVNYNKDFEEINAKIVERLETSKDKGIVLLHGLPGTGKTTYIKWLISTIKNKKILYVTPQVAAFMASPEFIGILMDNPDSILVVEDAENILMKRDGSNNEAVSNLLNLSDGLLAECFNVQIVATFNTQISNIDEALLRKGRLIAKYEFSKLAEDRALKLAEKLGVTTDGRTLADIYNTKDISFKTERKPIGFNK